MGFLRTYLALLVVLAHLPSFDSQLTTPFMGGAIPAVKFFFLLSGFYMSLVLEKKYFRNYVEFYKSRFLRLYPLYWTTCLFCLIPMIMPAEANKADYLVAFSKIDPVALKGWVIFSNITFFGSDLMSFVFYNCNEGSQLVLFPKNKPLSCNDLHRFMIIQPAWSLGIEMMFYLVIPFLARKWWQGVFVLLAISVTSRMFLFGIGYHNYDWSRHFIFSEAAYFAFGMVAYQLHKIIPDHFLTKEAKWLAAIVIFSWTTMYAYIYIENVNEGDRQIWQASYHWFFMVVMVVLTPFLFELSRHSKADFFAGELSYPIYITHIPVIAFLLPLFRSTMQDWSLVGKFAFCQAVIFAIALLGIALVSYPVEWLRGRRSMQARYSTALLP